MAELNRVKAVRAVELAQEKLLSRASERSSLASVPDSTEAAKQAPATAETDAVGSLPAKTVDGPSAVHAPTSAGKGKAAGGGETKADDAAASKSAAAEPASADAALLLGEPGLLYKALQLTSEERKRNQIVLLQDRIKELKLLFNKEFDDVAHTKREDIAKIAGYNNKIRAICEELKTTMEVFEPAVHVLEDPESLLQVRGEGANVQNTREGEEGARREKECVCVSFSSSAFPSHRFLPLLLDLPGQG